MKSLILHPHCTAGSIVRIDAEIETTPKGCRALFVASGDVTRIKIPEFQVDRGRFDDLWRTTCFEIFWQPAGGEFYREFNLSPSTRWACYDFDGFRAAMRNAPAKVDIAVTVEKDMLRLEAQIESELPVPAMVALNGIIEDADGLNRFWALAFGDGEPEFHSEACRALSIIERESDEIRDRTTAG
jgi:hypothetical protein